jgi:oligopeptide/dipeptide ABC transporter ATP-binding protein
VASGLLSTEGRLTVKDLDVSYLISSKNFLPACRDVQFDLGYGESIGLLGESGAGKSTVAYAVMGLIEPPNVVKGEINYAGKNVLKMSREELQHFRWNEVAMVFQAAMNSLDPVVTVGKNMDELILDKRVVSGKRDAELLSKKLLATVDLSEEVYSMYPFELSGGMKQRVIISMALATNPKILILDEPTTALDTITQFSVLSTIKSLKKEKRLGSLLLVSHDISVQAFMVDRILIMLKGLVIEDAPVKILMEEGKHPYTQVLTEKLKIETTKKSATTPGAPPMNGCPFANYCPYVMSRCWDEVPPLVTISDRQRVACFLFGG